MSTESPAAKSVCETQPWIAVWYDMINGSFDLRAEELEFMRRVREIVAKAGQEIGAASAGLPVDAGTMQRVGVKLMEVKDTACQAVIVGAELRNRTEKRKVDGEEASEQVKRTKTEVAQ